MNGGSPVLILEHDFSLTLHELSRASLCSEDWLLELVREGVLTPWGNTVENWRFGPDALLRARKAMRLATDFELKADTVALVLDLLDQVELLRTRG